MNEPTHGNSRYDNDQAASPTADQSEYFRGLHAGLEIARRAVLARRMVLFEPETEQPFDLGWNAACDDVLAALETHPTETGEAS